MGSSDLLLCKTFASYFKHKYPKHNSVSSEQSPAAGSDPVLSKGRSWGQCSSVYKDPFIQHLLIATDGVDPTA